MGSETNRVATGAAKNVRLYHSRSRLGCIPCKQRHIRCDEQRPSCSNCLSAHKICNFAPAKLPLRERRAQERHLQPWEQQQQQPFAVDPQPPSSSPQGSGLESSSSSSSSPYSISSPSISSSCSSSGTLTPSSSWQITVGAVLDPFNSFSVQMPLKSRELFQYFCQSDDLFSRRPSQTCNDHIYLVPQDQSALRNTLLIAALHYCWRVGSLQCYESTFYFHKVAGMRLVNQWLEVPTPQSATVCATLIATLCFTECCSGNLVAAEIHLNGLIRFLDTKDRITRGFDLDEVEQELMDRYFISIYTFLHGIKSRIEGISLPDGPGGSQKPSPAETEAKIHTTHHVEPNGLDNRLKGIRLFPYFFSQPPKGRSFRDIDAWPFLNSLRDATNMLDKISLCRVIDGFGPSSSEVFNSGKFTALFVSYIRGHAMSLSSHEEGHGQGGDRLLTSWSGIAATSSLYLQHVIGMWNSGRPLDPCVHRRVLLILKRDTHRTAAAGMAADADLTVRDLYFWKLFTAAIGLAVALRAGEDAPLRGLYRLFCERIRRWGKAGGVDRWHDARKSLARLVWPAFCREEALSEKVWKEAMDL